MKRNLILAPLLLAAAVLLSACGSDNTPSAGGASSEIEPASALPSSSSQPEVYTLDLMYIPLGEGGKDGSLYFDQTDNSALTLQLPEDLRDEDGKPITREDLNRGDVLRLFFSNGYTIGMTWPGQLFTEPDYAQVIHRGEPEDADKYQDAINSFYHPDPLHIPYLQFTHIHDGAAYGGSLAPEEGSYEWDCTDETGKPVHLSQQAEHPLLRKELPQLSFSGPFPLELRVGKDALEWEVRRWDASQKGDESLPEGELVTLIPGSVTTDGIKPAEEGSPEASVLAVVEDAAPDQVYQVTARWEEGWVSYGFELVQGQQ